MTLAQREQLVAQGYYALDRNENLDPTLKTRISRLLASAPGNIATTYADYPALHSKLCNFFKVNEDQLILTNGCTEAIRIGFNWGVRSMLFLTPTYPGATDYALQQANTIMHYLPDRTPFKAVLKYVRDHRIDFVYLCNPNNPSGSVYGLEELDQIRKSPAMFFIDEAYYDFCGVSAVGLNLKNVLIAKSFSKAWGLAGLRLGALIGPADTLASLSPLKLKASISSVGVYCLSQMLDHGDWVVSSINKIMKGDTYMRSLLLSRGYRVYNDPHVNFIWSDIPSTTLHQLKVLHKTVAGSTCITLAPTGIMRDIFSHGLPSKPRTSLFISVSG